MSIVHQIVLPKTSKLRLQSTVSIASARQRVISTAYRTGKGGFKVPRYQNTYHLESFNRYNYEVVDAILKDVMDSSLKGVKYDPDDCMRICQTMSATVRGKIFKKAFDRYKYVVVIRIIQKLGESIHMVMGNVWDVERDTYSKHIVETPDFIAIGIVAATYYE